MSTDLYVADIRILVDVLVPRNNFELERKLGKTVVKSREYVQMTMTKVENLLKAHAIFNQFIVRFFERQDFKLLLSLSSNNKNFFYVVQNHA